VVGFAGAPEGRGREPSETSIKSKEVRLPAERVIPPECPTGKLAASVRPRKRPALATLGFGCASLVCSIVDTERPGPRVPVLRRAYATPLLRVPPLKAWLPWVKYATFACRG
jgi:hypothetical protein